MSIAKSHEARIKVSPQNPFYGESVIKIRGTESTYMEMDDWETVPIIEVRVERITAANAGDEAAGLLKDVRVAFTAQELETIVEQLHGPLQILLQRKNWHLDTT